MASGGLWLDQRRSRRVPLEWKAVVGPWEELDVVEEMADKREGRESLEIFELETERSVLSKAAMVVVFLFCCLPSLCIMVSLIVLKTRNVFFSALLKNVPHKT